MYYEGGENFMPECEKSNTGLGSRKIVLFSQKLIPHE